MPRPPAHPHGFIERNKAMTQRNRDDMAAWLEGCAYWEAARGESPAEVRKCANRLALLMGITCRALRGEHVG